MGNDSLTPEQREARRNAKIGDFVCGTLVVCAVLIVGAIIRSLGA